MSKPPVELGSFLEWLREVTEDAWRCAPEPTLEMFERHRVGGTAWRPDTRWVPFGQAQVQQAEAEYGLEFPEDYAQFLLTLGVPRPWSFAASFEGSTLVPGERPAFTDWTDSDSVDGAMSWPLDGLAFDFEHNDLWLDEWGPDPKRTEARSTRVQELLSEATTIPVSGHRYIVNAPELRVGYVILSIYQSDVIVYGSDLRSYLLLELAPLLGDDGVDYRRATDAVDWDGIRSVPFWGTLVD